LTRELHEPQIFQRASKCIECSNKAVQLFKEVLENKKPPHSAEYYRARNMLREADKCFQETLSEAKRFMGPLPTYTSEEYLARREHLLEEFKILIKSREYDDLKTELMEDEHISKWMGAKELNAVLPGYFESQKEGKRKLANIKVRILIDKLKEFVAEAHRIQKEVLEIYHGF
jgi:hypothetical protein